MRVMTTDLEGRAAATVELTCDPDRRVRVDGQVVDAQRVIGGRIALVVNHQWHCVSVAEYWAVQQTAANAQREAEVTGSTRTERAANDGPP
jgi:hypothetical protein